MPIGSDQDKELYGFLSEPSLGAKIIDSRWSAFGRTDLVELEEHPDYKIIFVDGSAGTKMYRFDGNFRDANSEVYKLRYSTAYFPFYFANKERVLIIGPGGGVDVLIALMSGVNHTTAVEVNPEVVNIVRDYSDFNGGIYTKYDNVHVFVDEGRSFLKRTPLKYDVIILNIPVTKTAQGTSGYSLAENYLFTIDAFNDYLDHLEDHGHLVIVAHNHPEIHKLVAITLEVLQEEGGSTQEIMRHMAITENRYHPPFPVFILKKSAFTKGEIMEMYNKTKELKFRPVYFPYISSEEFCPIKTYLAEGKVDLSTLISRLPYDIGPPTDDRPFFYKFEKGLPTTLSQLLTGSAILTVIIIVLYLIVWGRRLSLASKKALHLLVEKFSIFMPYYFASLGLGFMLIEVSLIQKFMMFVGHPTLATSVLLFSLLLSSGIGSLSSRKWGRESFTSALRSSLMVGIIVISYIVILPLLLGLFLSYNSTVRFLLSIVLTFPLGFFMGIPFPYGIKALEKESSDDIAWMWCLNGVFSLLGSVLAVAMAMSLGFNAAFLFGGLSYFTIFAIGHVKFKKGTEMREKKGMRGRKRRRKRRR